MLSALMGLIVYLLIAGIFLYLVFLIIRRFQSPGLFYPGKKITLKGYIIVSLLGGGVFGPIFLFALSVSQAQFGGGGPEIFVSACLAGIILTWLCLFVAWVQYLNKAINSAEKTLKLPIIFALLYMAFFFLHNFSSTFWTILV